MKAYLIEINDMNCVTFATNRSLKGRTKGRDMTATLQQTPWQIAQEICREHGVNWKLVRGPGPVSGLLYLVRLQITERLYMDGHRVCVIADLLGLHHTSVIHHVKRLNNRARKKLKSFA